MSGVRAPHHPPAARRAALTATDLNDRPGAALDGSDAVPGGGVRTRLDRLADWILAQRSGGFRWGFVLAALAAATGLRFALEPFLPPGFPFLTFFVAIALTAVIAGLREGMVLSALCFATAWYFFVPPSQSFRLAPRQGLALLLYAVVVATELGLVYLMRRTFERLVRAEALARETARSRTLMFQELQHRVSNNLAVVASLLALQRRGVADPHALHALDAAAARVGVVSRLNRLLHDPGAQRIDFGAFLRDMVPDAAAAAGVEGRVAATVTADPVVVPAEKAVPLGLVATELLSNAFEHGFPDGLGGRVTVRLERGDGRATLTIADDGVGLPEGFDLGRSRSLGLQIARQFAGQLGAELSIERGEGGGVTSRLVVPLDEDRRTGAVREGPWRGDARVTS